MIHLWLDNQDSHDNGNKVIRTLQAAINSSASQVDGDDINPEEPQAQLIMSEIFKNSVEDAKTVIQLISQLQNYTQSWETHQEVIDEIRRLFDPNQKMLACSCCGEVWAEKFEAPQYSIKKEHKAVVPLDDLDLLQLTQGEIDYYYSKNATFRRLKSILPNTFNTYADAVEQGWTHHYHLHPELVIVEDASSTSSSSSSSSSSSTNANRTWAPLCKGCSESIFEKKTIPKWSIAAGCDYGNIDRLKKPDGSEWLRASTIAENMATSLGRPYYVCAKVSKLHDSSNKSIKLKTHMITFPHTVGPEKLWQVLQLPNTAEEIKRHFKVVFVGTGNFLQVRAGLLLGLQHAIVDADHVFEKLKMFKDVNVQYEHVRILALEEGRKEEVQREYATLLDLPEVLQADSEEKFEQQKTVFEAMVQQKKITKDSVPITGGICVAIIDKLHVKMEQIVARSDKTDVAGVRNMENDAVDGLQEGGGENDAIEEFFKCLDGVDNINDDDGDGDDDDDDHEDDHDHHADQMELESKTTTTGGTGHRKRVKVMQQKPTNSYAIIDSASLLITENGNPSDKTDDAAFLLDREIRSIQLTLTSPTVMSSTAPTTPTTSTHDPPAATTDEASTVLPRTEPIPTVKFPNKLGDREPFNEYTEFHKLLYMTYPDLFLFGTGIAGEVDKPVSKEYIYHLNRQFTGKFAKDKEFQFYIFNFFMRQSSAQVVAKKVRNNPMAAQAAAQLLKDPEFMKSVQDALTDVNIAKKVIAMIEPIMHCTAAMVPHSRAERKQVVTFLYALQQRFGLVNQFITFAPDDTNDTIMLRFCFVTKSNSEFPAQPKIGSRKDETSGEDVDYTFLDYMNEVIGLENPENVLKLNLPVKQNQKITMASMNSVAVARLYSEMQRILFTLLLGMEITTNTSSHLTYPRCDHSMMDDPNYNNYFKKYYHQKQMPFNTNQPPLGQGLAGLGVTEEQKKGTLHTHAAIWTTLKSELLSCIAGHKFLTQIVGRVIDSIFKTELPPTILFLDAACHELGSTPKLRTSREIPPQIFGEEDVHDPLSHFNAFVDRTVQSVQIHQHRHPNGACTPKSAVQGCITQCRLAKKSPIVHSDHTRVVEVGDTSSVEEKDNKHRFMVTVTESISRRSASTCPKHVKKDQGLADVDPRPLMYETPRRSILWGLVGKYIPILYFFVLIFLWWS